MKKNIYEYLPSGMRRSPEFIRATTEALDGCKLLPHESDRGCALVAGAILDEALGALLRCYFVADHDCIEALLDRPNAPLQTWSSKIDLCYALGLISRTVWYDLGLIRRIRNAAAHFDRRGGRGFATGFSTPAVAQQCRQLVLPPEEYRELPPRTSFEATAMAISSSLGTVAMIAKFIADNLDRAIIIQLMRDKPWTDDEDTNIRDYLKTYIADSKG